MYEDLIEAFQGIITDLCQYADKYRIDIQNRDRIHRNMEKAKELIDYRMAKCEKISSSTQNQHDFKHQDNSTESNIIF